MQRAVRLSEIIDHRGRPCCCCSVFPSSGSSRYLGSGSIATKMHRSCGLSRLFGILFDFNMAIRLWKSLVARKTGWKLWFPEFFAESRLDLDDRFDGTEEWKKPKSWIFFGCGEPPNGQKVRQIFWGGIRQARDSFLRMVQSRLRWKGFFFFFKLRKEKIFYIQVWNRPAAKANFFWGGVSSIVFRIPMDVCTKVGVVLEYQSRLIVPTVNSPQNVDPLFFLSSKLFLVP